MWTNLLQRPVNEFYWTNPRGMNTWKMDAEGQWLQATTSNYGLLSLGRVDTPGFSLQLAVRQNGWVGRFGIFYAGHRLSENPTTRSFELVEMTSTFQLSRQRGWIGPNTTGGVVRDLRPMALNARPDAPGNYDVLFRIDVMPRAGVFVHWRNAEYRELGDVLVKPANPDYRGEFGLYCDNCTVLVTSAQCMPLE